MTKLFAVLLAGLFSVGTFAQTPGSAAPKDAGTQTPAAKGQRKAEATVDERKAANPGVAPAATPTPGGNAANAAGSTMPVTTKAQKTAEAKKAKRKHGKAAGQGKTPT
jgi:hypothetical protein